MALRLIIGARECEGLLSFATFALVRHPAGKCIGKQDCGKPNEIVRSPITGG